MGEKSRIAAVQMVSGDYVEDNLLKAGELIAQAAEAGAQLIVLPEYFPLMAADDNAKVHLKETEAQNGHLREFLMRQARQHHIWLVGGTIPLLADVSGKVRNSALVFDPEGRLECRYDKIHLFDFQRKNEEYRESRTIEAGDAVTTFICPAGKVGVSVCYDLRFPELFRKMGVVDLIVLPAAFTFVTGQAHWEVLLRARAIENQCYVLACGQGGLHPSGRKTWGHSMAIDPWGTVLDVLPQGEGVVLADIDPEFLRDVRQRLPALQHRRLSF